MGEGGRGETQKAGKRKDGELSSMIIERERGERGKPTWNPNWERRNDGKGPELRLG